MLPVSPSSSESKTLKSSPSLFISSEENSEESHIETLGSILNKSGKLCFNFEIENDQGDLVNPAPRPSWALDTGSFEEEREKNTQETGLSQYTLTGPGKGHPTPDPPSPRSTYHLLPPSDFRGLRAVLASYLFDGVSRECGIQLSPRELEVLKFLLRKKFLFSHSRAVNSEISSISALNFAEFLEKNRPHNRTQLYKRTVFTNFCAYLGCGGGVREGVALDYRPEMDLHKGNLLNRYYKSVFGNENVRVLFEKTLRSEDFWEFCNGKARKNFEKNFEVWAMQIDSFLQNECEPSEEKKVLMRVKFMSVQKDVDRILRLFKLKSDKIEA